MITVAHGVLVGRHGGGEPGRHLEREPRSAPGERRRRREAPRGHVELRRERCGERESSLTGAKGSAERGIFESRWQARARPGEAFLALAWVDLREFFWRHPSIHDQLGSDCLLKLEIADGVSHLLRSYILKLWLRTWRRARLTSNGVSVPSTLGGRFQEALRPRRARLPAWERATIDGTKMPRTAPFATCS